MDWSAEERDGVTVVGLRGEFDADAAPGFQAQVDALLREGAQYFVVDLGGVSFIDSAGLAALVRLYKHVRLGEGDVGLASVPPSVLKILELTRLSRVFEIFPTTAEAAAALRRHE
jgi:anti-sigma B factor antagonist